MYAFRDCISNELLHTIFLYIMNNRAREEKVISLVFLSFSCVFFERVRATPRARGARAGRRARVSRECEA